MESNPSPIEHVFWFPYKLSPKIKTHRTQTQKPNYIPWTKYLISKTIFCTTWYRSLATTSKPPAPASYLSAGAASPTHSSSQLPPAQSRTNPPRVVEPLLLAIVSSEVLSLYGLLRLHARWRSLATYATPSRPMRMAPLPNRHCQP